MSDRARLRLSSRSVVVAVLIVALGLGALRVLAASTRVLGWVVVATIGAGLLSPLVARLSRRIPRPLAMVAVLVGVLGTVGALVYGSVDQFQDEARRLERVAPDAAERIEESERFGEAATEFELTERVTDFVDELPDRLRGGDTSEALRSAATRGVAFLATAVLTLFLILHGPNLIRAGLGQIHDPARRERLTSVLAGAYRRSWWYLTLTLGRAVLAGAFTALVCEIVEIPGSLLLAVWVGTFSLVPLIGVVTGAVAVILLSVAVDVTSTPFVAASFVSYQLGEVLLLQRRLERRSVHVGPVVTLVAAMLGLELYGIGGLLAAVAFAVFGVSFLVELAPDGGDESPAPRL